MSLDAELQSTPTLRTLFGLWPLSGLLTAHNVSQDCCVGCFGNKVCCCPNNTAATDLVKKYLRAGMNNRVSLSAFDVMMPLPGPRGALPRGTRHHATTGGRGCRRPPMCAESQRKCRGLRFDPKRATNPALVNNVDVGLALQRSTRKHPSAGTSPRRRAAHRKPRRLSPSPSAHRALGTASFHPQRPYPGFAEAGGGLRRCSVVP